MVFETGSRAMNGFRGDEHTLRGPFAKWGMWMGGSGLMV
jgi:hypothetical protein